MADRYPIRPYRGPESTLSNVTDLVPGEILLSKDTNKIFFVDDTTSPIEINYISSIDITGQNYISITNTTITANKITKSNFEDITANRILGRLSTNGIIQELTVSEIRTFINVEDGANNYTHPNHTGDVTSVADGATTIANNAVTNGKFRQSAEFSIVGKTNTGTGNVADIVAGPNEVLRRAGTGNLSFGGIDTGNILNNAITTDKIASSTSTTTGVTYAKMQHVTANRLLGRVSSNGIPQEISLGTNLSFDGTTLNSVDTTYTASDFDIKDLSDSLNKRTNWDAAYDWGDHRLANYLTSVALNDISNVIITSPATDQILKYNGTSWVNWTPDYSSGGGSSVWDVTGNDIYYTSGNVGINVSNPTEKLQVEVENSGTNAVFSVTNGGFNSGLELNSSASFRLKSESGTLRLNQNGSDVITLNNGKVGIGNSNPPELLSIRGSQALEDDTKIYMNTHPTLTRGWYFNAEGFISGPETYNMIIEDDASTGHNYNWIFKNSGNVSINEPTPTDGLLSIRSKGTNTSPILINRSGGTNRLFRFGQTGTNDAIIQMNNNSTVERIRLYANNDSFILDNLGLGITTPQARLHACASSARNFILQRNTNTTGEEVEMGFRIDADTNNSWTPVRLVAKRVTSSVHDTDFIIKTYNHAGPSTNDTITCTFDDNVIFGSSTKLGLGVKSPDPLLYIPFRTGTFSMMGFERSNNRFGFGIDGNMNFSIRYRDSSWAYTNDGVIVHSNGDFTASRNLTVNNDLNLVGTGKYITLNGNGRVLSRFIQGTAGGNSDADPLYLNYHTNQRVFIGDGSGSITLHPTGLSSFGGNLNVSGDVLAKNDVIVDGNVGINKSNPTERLEIDGNIRISGDIIGSHAIKLTSPTNINLDSKVVYKLCGRATVSNNVGTMEVTGISPTINTTKAAISVIPNWNTTVWVDSVTSSSFRVNFGSNSLNQSGHVNYIYWSVLESQ